MPSIEELEKRLRGRGTEKEEDIVIRINNGHLEISESMKLDYYHRITNHEIEECFKHMVELIMKLYPQVKL